MLQKAFVPTDAMRMSVHTMAKFGIPHEDIAFSIINEDTGNCINRVTLDKYFKKELRAGLLEANLAVSESLYNQAMGYYDKDDVWYPPIPACSMFWLKCRAGWRETDKKDKQGSEAGGGTLIVRAEIRGKEARKADKKKKAKKAKTDG